MALDSAQGEELAMRVLAPEIGVFVPPEELWLWQNRQALDMVVQGRQEAGRGDTSDLGSFAQYADLDIED